MLLSGILWDWQMWSVTCIPAGAKDAGSVLLWVTMANTSWQIVEMHEMVRQEWSESYWEQIDGWSWPSCEDSVPQGNMVRVILGVIKVPEWDWIWLKQGGERVIVFLPKKSSVATDTVPPGPHLEITGDWPLVSSKSLNGTEHLLPRVQGTVFQVRVK